MSDSVRKLRSIALIACATFAASVVGTGGCSHGSSAVSPVGKPSPIASGSPTPTPSPTPTANVFVSMAYASMQPTLDPTYGYIDGYALVSPPPMPSPSPSGSPSPTPTPSPTPKPSPTPTQTPGPSSIVTVPCNTNIQFENFDSTVPITASVLTPANPGGFPPQFPPGYNNPNGTNPSPILTPISFPGFTFSTGYVTPLTTTRGPGLSLVYSTGGQDGVWLIGDFQNYDSAPSMRGVIIVTGCP
jgi:hypothetical protein